MGFPLKIRNKETLDRWMNNCRRMGRDIVAIKGLAPDGATYSDGDTIERPVNVAWQCVQTGEIVGIEYDIPDQEHRDD